MGSQGGGRSGWTVRVVSRQGGQWSVVSGQGAQGGLGSSVEALDEVLGEQSSLSAHSQ